MATVLIVDDVQAMAEQYAFDLRRVGDFNTIVANGGKQALETIESTPIDCVILDLEMPGMDGFEVLRTLNDNGYKIPVIVYTGAGSYERCIRAIQMGAYSFIDKEESIVKVVNVVNNALEHNHVKEVLAYVNSNEATNSNLIGSSQAITNLRIEIDRIARIPSPVLILGESGTGKEVVAREIHRLSERSDHSFFAVNCGALPSDLVESELFGHEKGAFTGADRARKGAFQLASGGSIFLDEIGELPLLAQAVLLRVLEQKEVRRVGAESSIKVDARVIAATNRDLDVATESKTFREDLLYRLNVHVISIPPLRDRISDIPELAGHFARSICRDFGIPAKSFSADAVDKLMQYDWARNNVRELRNVVERAIIATDATVIEAAAVPQLSARPDATSLPTAGTFQERKHEAERQIVIAALKRNDAHITKTADALGLADHASLLKIMRRLGIQKD